ncbi:MAG: hypothetical protein WC595_00580 [Candidatus Nanoarchaeia archaeon]
MDLVKRLKEKSLKKSLSDEEVAKAILKVMLKSKQWKDHAKSHARAELSILATPGMNTHFEKKDEGNLPKLLEGLAERRQKVQEDFLFEDRLPGATKKTEEIKIEYGTKGTGNLGKLNYGPSGNKDPVFGYNVSKGGSGIGYNTPEAEQMVVAGCPCGFILTVAGSDGKVMEEHQKHTGAAYTTSNKSISDIYGTPSGSNVGYGTNKSIGYGTTPVGYSTKNEGLIQKEKGHGTGF